MTILRKYKFILFIDILCIWSLIIMKGRRYIEKSVKEQILSILNILYKYFKIIMKIRLHIENNFKETVMSNKSLDSAEKHVGNYYNSP